ncbi:MAG: nuclear transport factor 2 family protein [Novosphingobium sp.]
MRLALIALAAAALAPQPAEAKACHLSPKQVVSTFMTRFYVERDVRGAFETWVDPGYIQHNPMAATGRDAAIAFLEPFFKANPAGRVEIKRIIADGDLVAVHSWSRLSESDRGMAVVDILRVKGCKVVEHWDVLQPVPEKAANTNGMF